MVALEGNKWCLVGKSLTKVSFSQWHTKSSMRLLSYLSIPMTRLYELGSITLVKDRFRIQSELGGLEKRSEIESIKFCLTRSRGRHRMGGRPKYAHIYGAKDWAKCEEAESESEVLGSYQIAVSQQGSIAVRKGAECCRAQQEGGMEETWRCTFS